MNIIKIDDDFKRTFFLRGCSEKQDATIVFRNGAFESCEYHISRTPYSLDDWKFLGFVSEQILESVEDEKKLWEKINPSKEKKS